VTVYRRVSYREIRPGDVVKDPRGNRVIELAMSWGYKPAPTAADPYAFSRPWPKVGRMKVITKT
jgi:hypothetical protein